MIDPLPVGYTGLDQAVLRLTADISERDLTTSSKWLSELSKRLSELPPWNRIQAHQTEGAKTFWSRRELAIQRLYAALRDGALVGLVRDPDSGELFQLSGIDWHGAAYWRQIILGGRVRASACEQIERHNRRRVLLEMAAFEAWLKELKRSRPKPAENDCGTWLEAEMRASPERQPKPKREFRKEASTKFGTSGRTFDRIWAAKLTLTAASWGKPGAPSKLPRQ